MDPQKPKGILAAGLSILGVVYSLVVTVHIWSLIAAQQAMWPLPALYLFEVAILPVVCAAAVLSSASYQARLTSMAAGGILAFSILGAWSVGLFYVPVAALLSATALTTRSRSADRLTVLLTYVVGGALVQGAVMFLVIWRL